MNLTSLRLNREGELFVGANLTFLAHHRSRNIDKFEASPIPPSGRVGPAAMIKIESLRRRRTATPMGPRPPLRASIDGAIP
jgi:hypothetical protein